MDAKKIARAIMEYLDNMDIEFQILEKDAMLLFRTEEEDLSDASPVVYCIIAIEDSMYTVYTTSSDLSDADAVMGAIRDVSELVVRANWYCTPGHFDLNEDTGDIRYRNCVYCNAVPDDESIQDNIGIAIEEINAFSDDLRKVIQHHRTPRDVINQVQMNMRRVAVENDFVHFLIHQIEEAEEEEAATPKKKSRK
ncbi:MAG: YbjN domain-containing protein [Lachnospiraceae bacterium]|nr:YbjN domain-containing protein [Lachnospiraceae bacterium]